MGRCTSCCLLVSHRFCVIQFCRNRAAHIPSISYSACPKNNSSEWLKNDKLSKIMRTTGAWYTSQICFHQAKIYVPGFALWPLHQYYFLRKRKWIVTPAKRADIQIISTPHDAAIAIKILSLTNFNERYFFFYFPDCPKGTKYIPLYFDKKYMSTGKLSINQS